MIVEFIGWSGLPIYKKNIPFSYILCIEFIPVLIRRPKKELRRRNFEVRQGTKISCQMDFWEYLRFALNQWREKWWYFCLGRKSIYGYMIQKRIFWSTNIFFLANVNKYIKHLASNRFQSKQCRPFFSWPLDFRWLAIVLPVDRTPWRGKEKKWWQPIELNKSITSNKPIRSDGSKLILEVS